MFLFFLLGNGSLWAWNAFITPVELYDLLFASSAWELTFLSTFTSAFTFVGLVAVGALVQLQHLVSERRRIISSLLVLIAVFAVVSLFSLRLAVGTTASSHGDDLALRVALASSAPTSALLLLGIGSVASAAQAVLVGSLTSYATAFEPHLMSALTSGQAAAGMAVSTSFTQ